VDSQAQMARVAEVLGSILLLIDGVQLRVGLVGVEGVGKTSFALDIFKGDAQLRGELQDKLSAQKHWDAELSSLFDQNMFVDRDASEFPVASSRSDVFGECAIVDLFSVLHEELEGLSEEGPFCEGQRSPKEVEVMNNADLLIVEHPNEGEIYPIGDKRFSQLREVRGYDTLTFISQVEGTQERHITMVVPENGVLSKRFDKLIVQIAQNKEVQLIKAWSFD
jgi:hypothetical protein